LKLEYALREANGKVFLLASLRRRFYGGCVSKIGVLGLNRKSAVRHFFDSKALGETPCRSLAEHIFEDGRFAQYAQGG